MILKKTKQAAFTLIELMLVLGLLVLVGGALIFGYSAFREGAFKNLCLVSVQNVQDKMRAYASLNNMATEAGLTSGTFIGAGLMIEVAPTCKSTANVAYTYLTKVPQTGTCYATCTVAAHVPTAASTATW